MTRIRVRECNPTGYLMETPVPPPMPETPCTDSIRFRLPGAKSCDLHALTLVSVLPHIYLADAILGVTPAFIVVRIPGREDAPFHGNEPR